VERLDQEGNRARGILRIERVGGLFQDPGELLAAGVPRPGGVDAFEEVGGGGVAAAEVVVVDDGAAALGRTEALALVLAAALGRDLGVGATEDRVVGTEVDAERL